MLEHLVPIFIHFLLKNVFGVCTGFVIQIYFIQPMAEWQRSFKYGGKEDSNVEGI